jgi:tetratricopeptide (TPR) repeat protein
MIKLGVILLAATLSVMIAEFIRCRRRPLPLYGWFGLISLVAAEWLMFRGVEPVSTYFTAISWTAYILIADAAVFAIRGHSRLRDVPLNSARAALLSIPLWLIFEAYNLRLSNWIYVGLPASIVARWFGYAWAFATITPAIFVTSDLVASFSWWSRPALPIRFSRAAQNAFMAAGAVLLIVPAALPARIGSYLFGLVWFGFIFLLDPLNFRFGLASLQADLASGRRERLFSLLTAGWICGWLWEFWNFWAVAKWHYIFPILQNKKLFEMPVLGYLGFPPFALECFAMYTFAAGLFGWEKPAPTLLSKETKAPSGAKPRLNRQLFAVVVVVLVPLLACAAPARAAGPNLPDAAKRGLDLLYSGQPAMAMEDFRQVQAADPESPLGYLLEAEAQWWQIYCEACEMKWNTIDAWERDRPRLPADQAYLALTSRATSLAEKSIAQQDSAEMQLYDGLAWGLRARLLGLHNDRRGTARAGVNARTHLLRCLELDPQMADAYAGLGLYNYYVDTLSAIARVLRFLMGIPGGDKREGVRELRIAMQQGELTRVGARFYLAKNLRMYERDYAESLNVIAPLIAEFPQNPIFQLLQGEIQGKLGRRELASASFQKALQLASDDSACAQRIRALVEQARTTFAVANR